MSVYKLPMMGCMGGGGCRVDAGVGLEKLGEDPVVMEVWVRILVHPKMKECPYIGKSTKTSF